MTIAATRPQTRMRPPAIPLIVHDPFLSIWSFSDKLTDSATVHWTGVHHSLVALARIDGRVFTVCGTVHPDLKGTVALPQTDVIVNPTRTCYTFEGAGIRLKLTFTTPCLPHDLEWLSRPVTYITFDVASTDGTAHEVQLYWETGGEIAANVTDDRVNWGRLRLEGLDVMHISAAEQRLLYDSGDNRRIQWGHCYLALAENQGGTFLGPRCVARRHFAGDGTLPANDNYDQPCIISRSWPAMSAALCLGPVGSTPVSRHLTLAYDDIFSLEFLNRKLRPWWRRTGTNAADLLLKAVSEYANITEACAAYDTRIRSELEACGGKDYADVCALAFRQCLAAHKLAADYDGTPVYLSKENFSNGCIGTVDVTYPSSAFFLWLNPKLLQAQLDPVLAYADSPHWKFPFAPHDLGVYPLANGQAYGGGETSEEDQMPVEECGNMLILVAALVLRTGETGYAEKWWHLLRSWAAYLEAKGLNPENQLCTDDFGGHLAHNTNLSLKAIIALGSYAKLAEMIGKKDEAARVRAIAETMAADWQEMAEDGDHYRLTFDLPGSWSQKYNLIWDRLLGLELFPPQVAGKEVAFYKTKLNPHGLPLDNRETYTKLDWIFWSASLTDNHADFQELIAPSCSWVSAGCSRVPLADWYETVGDGRMKYFQARSVVGGLFIRQLKWSEDSQALVDAAMNGSHPAQCGKRTPTERIGAQHALTTPLCSAQ